MGFQAMSFSTDSPLDVHRSVGVTTSSFNNPSFLYDLNLPFKKRLMPRQDSLRRTKRIHLDTSQDEESYCSSQKLEEIFDELRKKFARADGLATEKAIKICSHSITKYSADKNNQKKIPKKMEREPVVSNEVTEQLKQFITGGEMNGVNMKLVIQKKLYKSDLERGLNRLNMPFKQLETREFLTEDEKQSLEQDKDIEVRLVGPTLQMYKEPMKLKMWTMNLTYNYVLITNWNHFVADHKKVFREGRKIQVWSFRRNQQLCFALAVVG